jgi:hypothetical protein
MGSKLERLLTSNGGPSFAPVSLTGAFVWSYRRLKAWLGARVLGSHGHAPMRIRPRACCRSQDEEPSPRVGTHVVPIRMPTTAAIQMIAIALMVNACPPAILS